MRLLHEGVKFPQQPDQDTLWGWFQSDFLARELVKSLGSGQLAVYICKMSLSLSHLCKYTCVHYYNYLYDRLYIYISHSLSIFPHAELWHLLTFPVCKISMQSQWPVYTIHFIVLLCWCSSLVFVCVCVFSSGGTSHPGNSAQLSCFVSQPFFGTKDEGYHCHDTRLVRQARMMFFCQENKMWCNLFKMRSSDVFFVSMKACRQKVYTPEDQHGTW